MNTYALVMKKTYTELVSQVDRDYYETINVYQSPEQADYESERFNTSFIVYRNQFLGKIDTKGILKSVETRVLVFDGQLDKQSVQGILNASGGTIWYTASRNRV